MYVIELTQETGATLYTGWAHDYHVIREPAQARKFATIADAECRIAACGLRDHFAGVRVVAVGEDGTVRAAG